ncbi:MAG TPA: SpoIID/LytB domain-containing protein [Solirubrobacterales bacterium]|nr:SpoIID/LytB domain-containing protein [Solirubrobacterales bacterium]
MRAVFAAIIAAATLCLVAAGPALGAKRWIIKGAGFGHGIGMSQYGAYGFAKKGTGYRAIVKHYYSGTAVGNRGGRKVRVLLRPYQPKVRISGATSACGARLSEKKAYTARRRGNGVLLVNEKGARVAGCKVLSATGGVSVNLAGKGAYRGAIVVRPAGVPGRVNAINAVDIEDYLRGVIAAESPSSWPLDALKAQALAARSYALSTGVNGNGFDFYDDTRSQVYRGMGAETGRTNRAVTQTAGEVVLHKGGVAETYFFSTSGGHTENNEFSFLGGTPLPYLRGVPDPYDGASPYHRWTRRLSGRQMQAELSSLVRGTLKRIIVTKRGASPRIVRAKLVGSGGTSKTTGPALRAYLGLPDTWATFIRK